MLLDGEEVESWQDIPGFDGNYQVNALGQVRSLGRKIYWLCRWGHIASREIPTTILKPRINKGGYLYVNLYDSDGRRTYKVHKLVAEVFLGDCPDGHQINHKSGNKLDNSRSNLEYVTPSQNKLHSIHTIRKNGGEYHPNSKLNAKKADEIRELLAQGKSIKKIAEVYNVTSAAISSIKSGRTWKKYTSKNR